MKSSRSENSSVTGRVRPRPGRPAAMPGRAADRRPTRSVVVAEPPSRQGSDTCRQFGEIERFDQVIVRSGVQSVNPVFDGIPGGDHDDRDPPTHRSEPAFHSESAESGQGRIQYHDSLLVFRSHPDCVRSVVRHVDGVAQFLEATLYQRRHA